MRTSRSLTVCRGWGASRGGSFPGGVPPSWGGVPPSWEVPPSRGGASFPACPEADHSVNRMTDRCKNITIGGSRGGVRDACPPPGIQILSISCSFRENLACSRPPWRVHAPPRENPGSATDYLGHNFVAAGKNCMKTKRI